MGSCLWVPYGAVRRHLGRCYAISYVKDLGEQIGRELDVAMIESPELTTRIISAYPHLKISTRWTQKTSRKSWRHLACRAPFRRSQPGREQMPRRRTFVFNMRR